MKTKMSKVVLMKALIGNRDLHAGEWEKAMDGYLKECEYWLTEQLALVHASEEPNMYCELQKPISHDQDYTTVIAMLEHTVEATIELDQRQYRSYVENNWEWREQWALSNSRYSR